MIHILFMLSRRRWKISIRYLSGLLVSPNGMAVWCSTLRMDHLQLHYGSMMMKVVVQYFRRIHKVASLVMIKVQTVRSVGVAMSLCTDYVSWPKWLGMYLNVFRSMQDSLTCYLDPRMTLIYISWVKGQQHLPRIIIHLTLQCLIQLRWILGWR